MKKFGLVFVLFFAYFVCVSNVYGIAPDGRCNFTDNSNGYLTLQACSFAGSIRENYVYHGYGPSGSSEYTDVTYIDYSQGSWVNNYNLFGYYVGSGNLINYSRPPHADDWSYENGFHVHHSQDSYTNDDGYVEYFNFFEYTTFVDFDFGDITPHDRPIRLDFAIHVNLTYTPDSVRKNMVGNLSFDFTMPQQSEAFCSSSYNYDVLRVSCQYVGNGKSSVVRLSNLVPTDYNYNSSVLNYSYRGYFDISDYSMVWGPSSSTFDENFNNVESPNGTIFNSNFGIIESHSSSFFENFSLPTYDGLTDFITIPLRFLDSDVFKPWSNNAHSLQFKVFNKTITIKNGNKVFWSRSVTHNINAPGGVISSSQSNTKLLSFRNSWNFIFGGFIIFILGRKCWLIILNLINPDSDLSEVFKW